MLAAPFQHIPTFQTKKKTLSANKTIDVTLAAKLSYHSFFPNKNASKASILFSVIALRHFPLLLLLLLPLCHCRCLPRNSTLRQDRLQSVHQSIQLSPPLFESPNNTPSRVGRRWLQNLLGILERSDRHARLNFELRTDERLTLSLASSDDVLAGGFFLTVQCECGAVPTTSSATGRLSTVGSRIRQRQRRGSHS